MLTKTFIQRELKFQSSSRRFRTTTIPTNYRYHLNVLDGRCFFRKKTIEEFTQRASRSAAMPVTLAAVFHQLAADGRYLKLTIGLQQ